MHIAILGATGAVGRTMLAVLRERGFPVDQLSLFASPRSAGQTLGWGGEQWTVCVPAPDSFRGVDIALFSAGADRSREWAPVAAAAGATVIDNSNAWRMDAGVPLVVPEINAAAARTAGQGIIANPNCSTIQMLMALEPIRQAAGLRRVLATTLQSSGGAGESGREALRRELASTQPGERWTSSPFSRRLAGNVLPHIGPFVAGGRTEEEQKMTNETRKVLELPELPVTATCVRVPVDVGHAVSLTVETEQPLAAEDAAAALAAFPGVRVATAPAAFPTPLEVAGSDDVYVGRIRTDESLPQTLHLWVVADNLRKGAATNAVQIAESLSHG